MQLGLNKTAVGTHTSTFPHRDGRDEIKQSMGADTVCSWSMKHDGWWEAALDILGHGPDYVG